MKNTLFDDSTRKYFDRVMDEWYQQTKHPYAENRSWLRKYKALQQWIASFDLENGRLLEVGCGTGLLQDVVSQYVGVDIATTSAIHMHKPFCVCSATVLPFPDNSFDGAFSIWVLEHIEQPEHMLSEIRRVLKPGGSVFICAAYAVDSWVSQGLHKRGFDELTLRQKLIKLTIPLRGSAPYKILVNLLLRLIDLCSFMLDKGPTKLRYQRLNPNYDTYWDYDADACASLDAYNLVLYFLSRGDRPGFGAGPIRSLLQRGQPQIYIIQK